MNKGEILCNLFTQKVTEIAGEEYYSRRKQGICSRVGTMPFSACETYPNHIKGYDIVMVDGSGGKGIYIWYASIGLNTKTKQMFPSHHSVGISLSDTEIPTGTG